MSAKSQEPQHGHEFIALGEWPTDARVRQCIQAAERYSARHWAIEYRLTPGQVALFPKGASHVPHALEAPFQGELDILARVGPPSGGLTGVLLRHRAAIPFATVFLQPTACYFGLESGPLPYMSLMYLTDTSRRYGHFRSPLFSHIEPSIYCDGALLPLPPTRLYGGARLTWYEDGEPSRIDADVLAQQVAEVSAVLFYWSRWPRGVRSLALAQDLAYVLVYDGWSVAGAHHFLACLLYVVGDEEVCDKALAGQLVADGPTRRIGPSIRRLRAALGQDMWQARNCLGDSPRIHRELKAVLQQTVTQGWTHFCAVAEQWHRSRPGADHTMLNA